MPNKSESSPFDREYFLGNGSHYINPESWFCNAYRDLFSFLAVRYLELGVTPKRVLEVGSGKGYIVGKLSDIANVTVFGIDLSTWAVSEGVKQDKGKRQLLQSYAEELPFPDKYFDCILSLYVFEHISDTDLLLQECSRVLKNKGRALIMVDTVKGDDKSHISVHTRKWWENKLSEYFRLTDRAWIIASKIAGHLPSWQQGHSRLNPGLYAGIFLLEK